MRIVALAVALTLAMAPLASAKKRHVASSSHAKKAAKHAKKVVMTTKVRPTRVASAAAVVTPAPAPAATPAAAPVAAPVATPVRPASAPIDRGHPAEQLSDDEVPGSRLKKR